MRGPRGSNSGVGGLLSAGGGLATLRRPPISTSPSLTYSIGGVAPRLSVDAGDTNELVHSFQKAALYVFGEKTHIKVRLIFLFYIKIYY